MQDIYSTTVSIERLNPEKKTKIFQRKKMETKHDKMRNETLARGAVHLQTRSISATNLSSATSQFKFQAANISHLSWTRLRGTFHGGLWSMIILGAKITLCGKGGWFIGSSGRNLNY